MRNKSISDVMHSTALPVERAYLVGAQIKGGRSPWSAASSLEELALLADTAGASIVGRTIQNLASINPALYVGKGKLEEITGMRSQLDYSVVIFDDELSPSQQRNLENALKVKVLDRTALILDIFAQHARTREGRLQVDLAQCEYLLPRLAGQWSHLERLEGRIGTRGPGETQLETDRRLVRNKIHRLKGQIEQVRRQRALHRRRRQREGLAVVSLVGYTNAGKSTLMRTLSKSEVLVEDRLFATLDPLTKRVRTPSGHSFLLTDTVGFIQKLPTQLVAAFRATLEEMESADLLLHVIDITHPNAAEQSQTVEDTLAQLGMSEKPRLTVLNKVDNLADAGEAPVESVEQLRGIEIPAQISKASVVLVSARRGWGLQDLLERIEQFLGRRGVFDITIETGTGKVKTGPGAAERGTCHSEERSEEESGAMGRLTTARRDVSVERFASPPPDSSLRSE